MLEYASYFSLKPHIAVELDGLLSHIRARMVAGRCDFGAIIERQSDLQTNMLPIRDMAGRRDLEQNLDVTAINWSLLQVGDFGPGQW